MVEVPENHVTMADIAEWYKAQEDLRALKAKEMLLRTKIFKQFFTQPKEGTNTFNLDDLMALQGLPTTGHVMKATHVINRDIDAAALDVLTPQFKEKKLPVGKLIKYKPELVKSEYNKLTEEDKHLFDQALIIKPGTPGLEIVLPKKRS